MIPFPTTKVQLLSPGINDTDAEDWGGAPAADTGYAPVGKPVYAHLSYPSGYSNAAQTGGTAGVEFRLIADPCDIQDNMQVKDLSTGRVYQVSWSMNRGGPLPYTLAGVRIVESTS